jgi:hypothetical protein
MALATADSICSSCGKFVPNTDIRRFLDGDPLLRSLEGFLDSCGYSEGFWNLCSICHVALLRGSVPKFSAKNNINVALCQHYPDALKDLTLTEEYLIAKSHPVGVLVKLRPGGQPSPVNYRALRGHFIVIPQDPKPLLCQVLRFVLQSLLKSSGSVKLPQLMLICSRFSLFASIRCLLLFAISCNIILYTGMSLSIILVWPTGPTSSYLQIYSNK